MRAEVRLLNVPGPMFAAGAGERGTPALGIDDAQLPQASVRIGLGQGVRGLLGRLALGQALEAVRAVVDVGVRLGGHGADAGLGPRHHAAHREKLALHRHTEVAGFWVEAHDGKRGHRRRDRLFLRLAKRPGQGGWSE